MLYPFGLKWSEACFDNVATDAVCLHSGFFCYLGPHLWNSQPGDLRAAGSVHIFNLAFNYSIYLAFNTLLTQLSFSF